jgi:hypothetical protein
MKSHFRWTEKLILKGNKSKNITIYVNDRELSKMTGQRSSNKIALKRLGWDVTVKGLKTLKQYEIEVE